MIEVRIHGRGGQGVVASAEMLAVSAIREGKYAQAFPSFGPERRGAPVVAFCRVGEEPIITREPILEPDVVLVLDPTVLLSVDVASGLKPGGKIVVNTCEEPVQLAQKNGFNDCLVATVDANEITLRILGKAITNTAMLGALIRVEPVVGLDTLVAQIRERFHATAKKNEEVLKVAYDEAKVADLIVAGEGGK